MGQLSHKAELSLAHMAICMTGGRARISGGQIAMMRSCGEQFVTISKEGDETIAQLTEDGKKLGRKIARKNKGMLQRFKLDVNREVKDG